MLWSGTFPSAGLSLTTSGAMVSEDTSSNSKLVAYLKANKTTEKYLVAVPSSASYATDIIINYGEPVMTLDGFSGTDNILTLDEFKQMVKNSEGGGNGNSGITSWIQENGKAISESQWSETTTSNAATSDKNAMGGGHSVQLYDLKGAI